MPATSNPTRPELTAELLAWAQRVDRVLAALLPAAEQPPHALHQAMRYSVLGGGKRIRPLLAYAACTALGGAESAADRAAAAVEIIHAYSLIHDDLPAMDDDDLRRGRPTAHIAFGEATAILAGDALQALAFEVLADDPALTAAPARGMAMIRTLATACGSSGMAGGQAFDLAAVGQRIGAGELERMHVHKTGALIRASVRLGALAAGCTSEPVLERLADYGHRVGLAFQIRDDILDIEGDTAVIGKTQGADEAREKPTYPSILGMAAARALAAELRASSLAALDGIAGPDSALADLARYAVDRNS
jgi:geranylgeranyl pyrophosphate synthase